MGRDISDPLAFQPDLAVLLAQPVEVLPPRPCWHRASPLPAHSRGGESTAWAGERPALSSASSGATKGCFKYYRLLHLQQICSKISPSSCSFHIDRRPGQRATVRS